MYKILPKPLLFAAIAWLVVGLFALQTLLKDVVAYDLKTTSIPGISWIVFSALAFKPVWRFFWKVIPWLREYFPDLNGYWDVELCSNWPRHEQVLKAANSLSERFDIRNVPNDQLAPLRPMRLRAEINQTWWSIQIVLHNPAQDTPIERSETVHVEPKPADGLTPPSISYIYKQKSATDSTSDDVEFSGAARLSYDKSSDQLKGEFWTARMWRRAMNTAGTISFIRSIQP